MRNHAVRFAPSLLALCLGGPAPAGASEQVSKDVESLRQGVETESPGLGSRLSGPLSIEDCHRIALERNLTLEVAREGRDAAHAKSDGAIGEFLPVLGLRASRSQVTTIDTLTTLTLANDATAAIVQRLPIGTTVQAGIRLRNTAGDSHATEAAPSLTVVQPLLRGGGWTAGTGAYNDTKLAAEAQDAALRADVLGTVFLTKSTYYDVLRRKQLIDVNQRAVDRDEELIAFSKAKLAAQLATQRDVLSAEIIQAQDRGRLVNAQADYENGLDQLSDVLGLKIGREVEVDAAELAETTVPVEVDAWLQEALTNNPSIQRARIACERADLARRVASNGRLPQLDLSLGYNQRREPFSNPAFERTWSGDVVASYPFLNKQRAADHEAAELAYEAAKRVLVETERTVTLDVRDSARNLDRGVERLAILKKNIEGAQSKLEFAKVNFQLGRASNLDITDAQKDLLSAETDHVNELVTYRVELARMEQLRGAAGAYTAGESSQSPR